MDPALYRAATQGNVTLLNRLLKEDPKILLSLTPQQNTALHIASNSGNHEIARRILQECETMLVDKNIDGDTPLHLASRMGKTKVLDLLIGYCVQWPLDIDSEDCVPLRIVNNLGNNALHYAVTYGKTEVALRLLMEDPDMGHKLNRQKETPLHIACRKGMTEVVSTIIKHPWVELEEEMKPAVYGTGSPFHQAVLGGHIEIVAMLLHHRDDLVKQVDSSGNNALHYAAQNDKAKMVEMLLSKDSSLAYLNNHLGQPPLHVAVSYGATSSIKAILEHCPDTAEHFSPSGGNALHVAVSSRKLSSLKCLLKHIHPEEIINHQDNDGNTALHLASLQSRTQSSLLLIRDKRVDLCKLNNKGQTARSAIETPDASTYDMFVWKELKKHEKKRCNKQQLPPITSSESFARHKSYFELSVQTYTLVAALIATVTFAATFTMPGGYNQLSGAAILAKNPVFKTFVISNTLAMCSALVVLFSFVWTPRDPGHFIMNQLTRGHNLLIFACLSMIVSLMTAVYLVVESEAKWLGLVVIFIGCCTPAAHWFFLGYETVFVPLSSYFSLP